VGEALPLAELTISEYLDRTAARTPAPGGGAAAAIAAATAAALVQMAAAFAPDDEIANRAEGLRARLLELADDDLVAYEPVLEALRRDRSDPERPGALAAALSAAAEPPLAIAAAAAEVAELGGDVMPQNQHLSGDATAAVMIATGAVHSAVRLVELNLANVPADPRLVQAEQLDGRAVEARARVESP
jgi:formiminotetrahydrofolate cyclodeaminase